ncbi:MAG: LysM peptidoglycan-binding domain-containing protein [Candidatus Pedobacter colombiensis]|uniref:LysM peptidoglycan-binding domain-containing protein n=1 Tax=Candidatus Pedobacter colombiensis TaxID=3121371 RepID=A0AAJ5W3S1_9SPHI|nr:LysM peptidoglycan-binding domain-containing protein [Pedobacter sp.]WEK17978.1 MAG: LysM peptidoglycan-binding domain-containing protein [Pedobacter sp.]
MHKYYIVSILALLINLSTASAITRDSIGVENRNGKKLIIHQVDAKDTYYSIGRRYNVSPKDIMNFNDSKFLQIGVIVKVPTSIPFTASTTSGKTNQAPVASTTTDGNLTEHTVQKKENLNMLAERYGTTVNEIKRVNNLNSSNLQIGQLLKIPGKPAEEPATEQRTQPVQIPPVQQKAEEIPVKTNIAPENRYKKPEQTPEKKAGATTKPEEFIEHTVASNETIYSIATRYKLTMDQLKAKNNLTDNSLRVGQKLLISGQYPPKNVQPPAPENHADTLNSIKDPALRYPASRYGLNQIDEKGTGMWIADADLDPSKMLVLHRTAPVGTVMKITNPMTNRSTFAKVVGKFTENESTKDVIIVMTKAVADALGALDKRFYCNLTYGGQDNEQ